MNQGDDDCKKKLLKELEEKEKDLILSAQIGKELLEKNNKLEDRNHELESELRIASESIEQLSYQLNQKNDLIQVLTNDDCGSENGKFF